MKIEKNTAVMLRYSVSEVTGKLLEDSKEPKSYLHGYGNILARIEQALEGQCAGFQADLLLQPEDSFGVRNEALLQTIPKTRFPPGVKVGGQLEGIDEEGRNLLFTVLKIKGDTVYLDGNHPWAGKTLHFDVQVLDVRAATEEEIAHGHVHGAHGHQH